MKRLLMLIVAFLPLLAGCESYTWLLYANPALNSGKQGQECLTPDPLGLARQVDMSGNEAMRRGGITKVRTVEYQVAKFHGWGTECVIARGE